MNRKYVQGVLLVLLAAACACASRFEAPAGDDANDRLNLVIVVDGLRPDYITPEHMPNLYALGERGVFADRHSAAFPSVTRVNSATISTGSYPARHGLMDNTMFMRGYSGKAFSTGSARTLRKVAGFAGGQLLTSPSMAELLDEQGLRLFVTGSGGSGSSLLQNPVPGTGMGIWTAGGFFVPAAARAEAVAAVGRLVEDSADRTAWAFDAWLHKARSDDPPEVVIMWIGEPDAAGHRHGVGAPATLEAVANVDRQIGRMVASHAESGLNDRVNIFVTSDHGFSTNGGRFSVARILRENDVATDGLTIVGNMIFFARDDPAGLVRVVEALQRDPETGNVYTRPARPGSGTGIVPGTLSTAVIQWDHQRASDVFVTPNWSDEVNEFGFAGASTRGGRHAASHGSDSPYDMQIRLVAAGPDLKRGIRSQVPTGNVDLAPTLLHLSGMRPPRRMSGRVLHELLRGGEGPGEIDVRERTHRAAVTLEDGLRYEAELDTLAVGSTVYLRAARTKRSKASVP